ncbi:YfbM family protein [Plasticicumulans lactativorans]|nr:YfbM family protein [Plasticicumulans lactativorans]
MSMLCSLYRITPEQITRLKDYPGAVSELVGFTAPPPKASFLSKLFGKPPKQPSLSGQQFEPVAESDIFELNQAWHILHYLFSGTNAEGPWPSGFLMSGGEEIGPDQGYGPIRLLDPERSRAVATFLDAQSFEIMNPAYVASDIEAAEIYWQASSEHTERQRQLEELWSMVKGLQAFFEHTTRAGNATLVSIY